MMSTPQPRILLIVPDPTRQRLVRSALSRGGVLVVTEESGEAALRRCALTPPAAVIVAMAMPGLNGLQVLTRLRTDYPKLPVYLMDDDSAGGRMGAEGLAAGAAAVLQSAQVGDWANQIVKDLASAAAVGQARAWLADPPPGLSAYLVEEHLAEAGLPLYPDSDDLVGANADHLLSQPRQPAAAAGTRRSPGVAEDSERMRRSVSRPGREPQALLSGPAAPMQRRAPLRSPAAPTEHQLLPVLTALLERHLPVILAQERTKAMGEGGSRSDLMPALRSINEGFRIQMTRQLNWSLRQIALDSEAQTHAIVTAVVIQHIEPVRQQVRRWRGLALVALTGLGVLGGTLVSQFI